MQRRGGVVVAGAAFRGAVRRQGRTAPHPPQQQQQRQKRLAVGGVGLLFHRSASSHRQIHDDILSTVGSTPVVRINRLVSEDSSIADGVEVFAKCEFFNPLGSVKDRLALGIIEDAERRGLIHPSGEIDGRAVPRTIVEATSGNTGIGLAMVCAAKGYRLVTTMAESFSVERRRIMRMLGAQVVLTPAAEKGTGMVKKAQELAQEHGWFQTRQFENGANAAYHAQTTGAEIVSCFASEPLTHFVTGYGTGGTVSGVGKVLRAASPQTKIVLAEPSIAALVDSGKGQQRQADGSSAATHEAFTPHPIQGWTPDFIPKLVADAQDASGWDEVRLVEPPLAVATARALASREGIFTGISGGGSMAVALEVAREAPAGSRILTMLPDTAERYMSTPLFETIEVMMNEGEIEIARSTPGFHTDQAKEA